MEWKINECTIHHINGLLSKAFGDMARSVRIRAVDDGKSIAVICYAPLKLMDFLLMSAKDSLYLLKEMGVIKLIIGYHVLLDRHKENEVRNELFEDKKNSLLSRR